MKNKVNIDNSTLVPVAGCTTQAALKALGFAGTDTSEPLDIGSVVHDGLEAFFKGENHEAAFDRSWASYFPEERIIDRDQYQYRNVYDIFTTYCDRHPIESLPFDVLETEKMVGMPLDESGIVWFWMKRDLKVVEKSTGVIVPLDHKTTGWDVSAITWQKKWKMASQLSGYIWATQKETGTPCPFAYVNGVQINKLPDSNRKCYKHQMKFSECRLEHTNFTLLTYMREQHQLEAWWATCMMLAFKYKKMRETYPDLESIMNAPCEGFFINGVCDWCEFDRYCRMGKRPQFADALLVHKKWAPWEDEGVKIVDWRG